LQIRRAAQNSDGYLSAIVTHHFKTEFDSKIMSIKLPLPREGSLWEKRGNEGDVHHKLKKLIDTPLNTLFKGGLIPNK